MCGFGDKVDFSSIFPILCITITHAPRLPGQDRRPLAPAAVAKLVVKDKDDRIIPPECASVLISWKIGTAPPDLSFFPPHSSASHVDTAFFVVLVDLWSQDGAKEHNLVRVPVPNGVTSRRYRVQRAGSQPSWQRNNGTVSRKNTSPGTKPI